MTFVADENGFQPQSDALPVAPAFPHPIPDFVLEQIEFARQQKDAESREAEKSVRVPNSRYGRPDSSEETFRVKRDTAPAYTYSAPRSVDSAESAEFIPILRDTRVQEEDGTYSTDVETGNGIVLAQSGDSDGEKQGIISFTHPDGTPFHMTYIADENGFQPQSDALPVAPAFPHPIPDFVLEQIEFARLNPQSSEEKSVRVPSSRYGRPDSSEETFRVKRDSAPAYAYSAPRSVESAESAEFIPILRDTRVQEEDGIYSTDIETGNGIVLSQAGDSSGEKQGVISFTHPDGTPL